MKFPTIESFEKKKEQQIIKWRELPENIVYHVISVTTIETTKFGTAMYAAVEDEKENKYIVWLPSRLGEDLKDYESKSHRAYVVSKGLEQSKKHKHRQYFAYEIKWEAR